MMGRYPSRAHNWKGWRITWLSITPTHGCRGERMSPSQFLNFSSAAALCRTIFFDPVRTKAGNGEANANLGLFSLFSLFSLGLRRAALYSGAQFALAGSARTIVGTGL